MTDRVPMGACFGLSPRGSSVGLLVGLAVALLACAWSPRAAYAQCSGADSPPGGRQAVSSDRHVVCDGANWMKLVTRHANGGVDLGASLVACTPTTYRTVRYDETDKKFYYCSEFGWTELHGYQ